MGRPGLANVMGQPQGTEGMSNPMRVDRSRLIDRLTAVFLEGLDVDIGDPDEDLISTGVIDSLGIVTLLLAMEQEFGVEISIDDFEIDDFRSVARIADFVSRRYFPENDQTVEQAHHGLQSGSDLTRSRGVSQP
jgi:D-alanine--poly(phosphoribitol) ligase subunit 2